MRGHANRPKVEACFWISVVVGQPPPVWGEGDSRSLGVEADEEALVVAREFVGEFDPPNRPPSNKYTSFTLIPPLSF